MAKWYTSAEAGWEHAQLFRAALSAGALRLTAPEHMRVEVVRLLQLSVRDKRYTVDEGVQLADSFLSLPVVYVDNDILFESAFRLACAYLVAIYDALYLALAVELGAPLITADRRFFNLAQQRHISSVAWFEDVAPER